MGNRHSSQKVCPWNVRFAQGLKGAGVCASRVHRGKDALTIFREVLAMSPDAFSTAFRGSPMKRAKRRGLARSAAVTSGNVGMADNVAALARLADHAPHE